MFKIDMSKRCMLKLNSKNIKESTHTYSCRDSFGTPFSDLGP